MVLDTMVHKNQKFVMVNPIEVSFEKSQSCNSYALMSDSECLVFTRDFVTLVSLVDQAQKQLDYPQGLTKP